LKREKGDDERGVGGEVKMVNQKEGGRDQPQNGKDSDPGRGGTNTGSPHYRKTHPRIIRPD